MTWRHYTETLRIYSNGGNSFADVVKHTFALRLFGRDLVVTWCWC